MMDDDDDDDDDDDNNRSGLVPILRLRTWLKPTQLGPSGNNTLNPAHALIPIPQRQTVIFSSNLPQVLHVPCVLKAEQTSSSTKGISVTTHKSSLTFCPVKPSSRRPGASPCYSENKSRLTHEANKILCHYHVIYRADPFTS